MDNSKHLTCEEDIFKWSGTVEELQELVNSVLTDMKVHVENGELTEDKSHKAFTYKCNEYSVRFYQTSKKLKLFGANSVLMDKFYEISAAAKESSAEAVDNEDDEEDGEDETDNDLETLRDELDIIKREVSLIKNSLNDKEANSNLKSELQLSQNENEKLRTIIDMQKEEICKLKIESQSLLNVISLLSVPGYNNASVTSNTGPRDYYAAPREYQKSFDTVDLTKESTKTKEDNQSKNKTKTKKKQNKSSSDDNHSAASSEQTRKSKQSKATTVIVGDSMISKLDGWKMSTATNKVIVKPFSGATSTDMLDYIKPIIRKEPDEVILHVGTNDLASSKEPKDIAENIVKVCQNIEDELPNVRINISEIIFRKDSADIDKIRMEVNKKLKAFCKSRDWKVISHSFAAEDLNPKGIHLNKKGISNLAGTLNNYLKSAH